MRMNKSTATHIENHLRTHGIFLKREPDGTYTFWDDDRMWSYKGGLPDTLVPQKPFKVRYSEPELLSKLIRKHGIQVMGGSAAKKLIHDGCVHVNERRADDPDCIIWKNSKILVRCGGHLDIGGRAHNFEIEVEFA